ncbi:hypothetical protein ACTXLC_12510, partial [Corynebacterium flavescens]
PTGEDTHGCDYFTSIFLLPQLCNSTDRDMMSVSHGTAIRTITTYTTGVDGGFSGYMTNCR